MLRRFLGICEGIATTWYHHIYIIYICHFIAFSRCSRKRSSQKQKKQQISCSSHGSSRFPDLEEVQSPPAQTGCSGVAILNRRAHTQLWGRTRVRTPGIIPPTTTRKPFSCDSTLRWLRLNHCVYDILLRAGIVNRTYSTHKKNYGTHKSLIVIFLYLYQTFLVLVSMFPHNSCVNDKKSLPKKKTQPGEMEIIYSPESWINTRRCVLYCTLERSASHVRKGRK